MRQSNTGLALLLFLLLLAVLPVAARAQTAPDLVVTLRDGADAGIAGATVTVRDRDGTSMLAQAQTDATGTATIPLVQMSDVRIAVTGKMSNGTSLKQLDSDAEGIALFLDGAQTTQLDLRVEDDGTVIPDPQAMSEPQTVPTPAAAPILTVVAPVPSAVSATEQPTASLLMMASPAATTTLTPPPEEATLSASRIVVLILGGLVLIAVLAQLGMYIWRERGSR